QGQAGRAGKMAPFVVGPRQDLEQAGTAPGQLTRSVAVDVGGHRSASQPVHELRLAHPRAAAQDLRDVLVQPLALAAPALLWHRKSLHRGLRRAPDAVPTRSPRGLSSVW